MNNSKEHIFSANECVSEELMFAYIDSKLSPGEKHLVEMHLEDCEFCADAMEGLALIKNRDIVRTMVEEVKGEKNASSGKIIPISRSSFDYRLKVAAAAAVLLLGGYTVYFSLLDQQNEKVFAEAFDVYPSKKSVEETEQVALEESLERTVTEKTDTDEKTEKDRLEVAQEKKNEGKIAVTEDMPESFAKDTETRKPEEKPMQAKEEVATLSIDANKKADNFSGNYRSEIAVAADAEEEYDNELSDKIVVHSKVEAAEKTKAAAKSPAGASSSSGAQTGERLLEKENNQMEKARRNKVADSRKDDNSKNLDELKAAEKNSKQKEPAGKAENSPAPSMVAGGYTDQEAQTNTQSNLSPAMEKYDGKDYQGAIVLFETILKTEPENEKALFYSAVSNLSLNKADNAITLLDNVLKLKSAEFTEAAKWYKALALIKKNEEKKAKKLLTELIKGEGDYKKKAEELLLKLKE